ncbi:hypothetical protein JTB14_008383 [Gonioctena quinquepunctata]|nr:hypothetical protein JTB14_008383 [Gonioctena quinquepunctata]
MYQLFLQIGWYLPAIDVGGQPIQELQGPLLSNVMFPIVIGVNMIVKFTIFMIPMPRLSNMKKNWQLPLNPKGTRSNDLENAE